MHVSNSADDQEDAHPRFALDGGASGNVIVDYLEFLYRTYVSAKWLDWARRRWRLSGIIDPDDIGNDPFERIMQAFPDAQFGVLDQHAAMIARIKQALRQAKDSLFDVHVAAGDRLLLEYPSAR